MFAVREPLTLVFKKVIKHLDEKYTLVRTIETQVPPNHKMSYSVKLGEGKFWQSGPIHNLDVVVDGPHTVVMCEVESVVVLFKDDIEKRVNFFKELGWKLDEDSLERLKVDYAKS